jgi:hypothetical protein
MSANQQGGEVVILEGYQFEWQCSDGFMFFWGTYRGTISGKKQPEGNGDFDGWQIDGEEFEDGRSYDSGENRRCAYSGTWRGGNPSGMGWWQHCNGDIYAGEIHNAVPHGHAAYWSPDGCQCFQGQWDCYRSINHGTRDPGVGALPIGLGNMLRADGELWRVRFTGSTLCYLNGDDYGKRGWDEPERLDFLGRVVAGGPAPVARREDRGVLPEWIAQVSLKDETIVMRRFQGLTQVRNEGLSRCYGVPWR